MLFVEGRRVTAAALPLVVLLAAGCAESGASPGDAPDATVGVDRDAAAPPSWMKKPRQVTRKGDAPVWNPGAAPDGGPRPTPAIEPDAAAPPTDACVPASGPDVLDDAFADTNCDGIDGDANAAIFVAPTGSDEAEGTREAPVQTLAGAVLLARDRGKSAVYACAGVYVESLELSDPIAVSGGFDCENGWARLHDVSVVRPAKGAALRIKNGRDITFHRMAFQSENAKAAGESSIAVVVSESEGIAFQEVDMVAGDGAAGREGGGGYVWAPVIASAPGMDSTAGNACRTSAGCGVLLGSSESDPACHVDSVGGRGHAFTCPGSTEPVQGGAGGRGGNCGLKLYPEPGMDGTPAAGPDGVGRTGARGAAGTPGPPFGSVVNGSFIPASGSRGGWGSPGSAGRGGDGSRSTTSNGDVSRYFTIGGGGGQGGYPGCGGRGGEGGGGGGGSIALLVERSVVKLAGSRLVTGRGGDGGAPANGGSGQPGGSGARGAMVINGIDGSPGKKGGDGGNGGPGGPGAGGPSIAIVHVGVPPESDVSTSFELGEPGIGGARATLAPDGVKANVHEAAATEVNP